ncbi:unnamed protein product [Adineta ricciae]|uniref:Heme haloperoxidase family profile domain-containing protein n=1 Tax=Adineta ricciae TaxID=249248 RepID=A0A814JAB0_ADIRI|nr:unnamed protein product [Adineta ricciae]CAF1036634.1 unnamed protein product [Adineta ricciae]
MISSIVFILVLSVHQCDSYPYLASKLQPDIFHPFQEPGPNDIRGPCPGLNAAANHGFISRSGITTLAELVQMQQDLYNVGLDLAIVLATVGVALDGDILTGKLSIGKESSAVPGLLRTPGGLNAHNKFEGDTSLTRNDYYLADGDNFRFNGTLYGMMYAEAQKNNGLYSWKAMADYPLLLYGAATFLYELFPNGTDKLPTEKVISSFFGAKQTGNGKWAATPERIPSNWYKRETPYTLVDVAVEILKLYLEHIALFGGNTGRPNSFILNPLQLTLDKQTVNGILCFLYQTILSVVPSQIETLVTTPLAILNYLTANLDPIFGPQFGCPSTSLDQIVAKKQ